MAKYIRIKKSKNLRYKLISILYLLFISLSIIQIPIDWLRVSPEMRNTFLSLKSENLESPLLQSAQSSILDIDKSFTKLVGLKPETGKLKQPENYALSDQFYLNSPVGERLFQVLIEVKDSLFTLNPKDPLRQKFAYLFEQDLTHGLGEESALTWLEWKFKHVPASVARLELSDLVLKLNLLQGELEISDKAPIDKPSFILAYNIDRLHIGDTAYFVYSGQERPMLEIKVNNKGGEEYVWENDTLRFMALDTGYYEFTFTLNQEQKLYSFKVLPGNFRNSLPFQDLANYTGLAFDIPLNSWQKALNYSCDCMAGSRPKKKEESLRIQPTRSGWCRIKGFTSELQALAFQDSVYVHPLPAPLIYTSGISANEVSRSRLRRLKEIPLKVLFPNQPKGLKFQIKSIKAQLHHPDHSELMSFEKSIVLTAQAIEDLQYIEIQEVTVQSLDGPFSISDRLIINVIGDEV